MLKVCAASARIPEVVVLAAGREHQVVERDILAVTHAHDPTHEVGPAHLGLQKVDIVRRAEGGSKRIGDVGGGQQRCRDLVEQRRELVVVAPVDEQHVDRPADEPARARQAGEAAADNHHPGPGHAVSLKPPPGEQRGRRR
jgi:hypothetical protein